MAPVDVRLNERLADAGYGAALVHWAQQLAPYCDAREWRRLCQLIELGVLHQTLHPFFGVRRKQRADGGDGAGLVVVRHG